MPTEVQRRVEAWVPNVRANRRHLPRIELDGIHLANDGWLLLDGTTVNRGRGAGAPRWEHFLEGRPPASSYTVMLKSPQFTNSL
jgi:hypothetical protein